MNKLSKTTLKLGAFLTFVILTYSIYVIYDNKDSKIKFHVTDTRTEFHVFENDDLELGAYEYLKLWDGSRRMRSSSRELFNETINNITIITRISKWKDNITTIHKYLFDSNVQDIEKVPVDSYVICINCISKIVMFEYSNILYLGDTQIISSPFSFGHNMKVEWQDGAYYSKVLQQKVRPDKIIIKYRPTKNYEIYHTRMYDPITSFTIQGVAGNIEAELNTNITVKSNSTEVGFGGHTFEVCIDIDHPDWGVNVSCGTPDVITIFNISYFRKVEFNDTNTSLQFYYDDPTASNQSFGIIGHQYDEIINVSINLTAINGTPQDVKLFINGTLSNSLSGQIVTTVQALTTFNNTNSTVNESFTEATTFTYYVRLPKASTVSYATMDVVGSPYRSPLGANEYFFVVEASSLTIGDWGYGVSAESLGGTLYLINISDVGGYEVSRAKMMESLFSGGSASNLTVKSGGISKMNTYDNMDVGYRGYWKELENGPNGNEAVQQNYTMPFDGTNIISSWSYFKSNGGNGGQGQWYVNETLLHTASLGAGAVSSEFGLDKTADEKTNKSTARLWGDTFGNALFWARAIIFMKGQMTDGPCHGRDGQAGGTCVNRDYQSVGDMVETGYLRSRNTKLDIGIADGVFELSVTGEHNTTEAVENFNVSLNTFLASCTADGDGFCNAPIKIIAGAMGIVSLTNLTINYSSTYNPIYLDRNLIIAYLGNSTNFTNIVIDMEVNSTGVVEVHDLRYNYLGGNFTVEVTAHNITYTENMSRNVTFFYSDYDYTFGKSTNEYLQFLPRRSNSLNVSADTQFAGRSILNFTAQNYGSPGANYSILLNESFSCVNLTVSTTNNKGVGNTLINNTWYNISSTQLMNNQFNLWLWADYNCSFDEWRLWYPEIFFRGCRSGEFCGVDIP